MTQKLAKDYGYEPDESQKKATKCPDCKEVHVLKYESRWKEGQMVCNQCNYENWHGRSVGGKRNLIETLEKLNKISDQKYEFEYDYDRRSLKYVNGKEALFSCKTKVIMADTLWALIEYKKTEKNTKKMKLHIHSSETSEHQLTLHANKPKTMLVKLLEYLNHQCEVTQTFTIEQ